MEKEVAIIICNFNKQEYVIKCIESVLKSTYTNYDIFVVDNASIDNSVESIRKIYGDKVELLINEENKGGSGGFNTGMRHVIDKGYKYIYLLDNDVIIDKDSLANLYNYLESNTNVGAVGSKIYFMDRPNVVQEFGSYIDFNSFNMRLEQRGQVELESKIEIIECDYVPACSALFKVEALKKVGVFNDDYFVYWDDIDLGYRINLAGYKVVANSNSRVWHKGGGTVRYNTFGTYYFWRNRTSFFTKFCNESNIQNFVQVLFDEIIRSVYSCNYIGKYSSAKTILRAVDDALNNKFGKASTGRIFEIEHIESRFEPIIKSKNNIAVITNECLKGTIDVIDRIINANSQANITIVTNVSNNIEENFPNKKLEIRKDLKDVKELELKIKVCSHVFKLKELSPEFVYVDEYFNIIETDEDRRYIKNYDEFYNLNKNIFYPILLDKILEANKKSEV